MAQNAIISSPRPFVAATRAAPRRQQLVTTCAVQQQQSEQQLARRSVLAGLALLLAAPSQASVGRWDGESSAIGSCELGDAGTDCRLQILAKDKDKFASYESTVGSATAGKVSGQVTGVPVAEMNDAYTLATIELTDKLLAYAAFADPTDPERIKLVKQLKGEMERWVSKYARGGSARKTSARKVYVVVDAFSAHFATNGLAPLPRAKLAKLVDDIQAGRELLAQGK